MNVRQRRLLKLVIYEKKPKCGCHLQRHCRLRLSSFVTLFLFSGFKCLKKEIKRLRFSKRIFKFLLGHLSICNNMHHSIFRYKRQHCPKLSRFDVNIVASSKHTGSVIIFLNNKSALFFFNRHTCNFVKYKYFSLKYKLLI